ncbi:MAG: Sec-independent protein translocase protein TatA [Candidatus Deianiraeaceae bacterium]|jgi:Sec-independent protein translocase protein TatA
MYMGVSFGEIIIVCLVAILFFKPHEIKAFLKSVFSAKRNLEKEVHALTSGIEKLDSETKYEFFDVKCHQKQR